MDNTYNDSNVENNNVATLPKNYQPNPDELKVLAQCRSEGNIRGGITAILSGGLAYQSIKSFKLSVSPSYGVYPKVGAATLFGFFLGKIMSIPSCYEKLKSLPNSPIGTYMRQRKGGQGELLPMATGMDTNLSFASVAPSKYKADGPMNSALDIDVYNSPSSMDSYTGDELNGPGSSGSNDNFPIQNDANKQSVSYAELRQRNREEYVKADKERYNLASSITNDTPPARQPIKRSPSPAVAAGEKNQYGDVWG